MRSFSLTASILVAVAALGAVGCDETATTDGRDATADAAVDVATADTRHGPPTQYDVAILPSLGGARSGGNGINARGWSAGTARLAGGEAHAALWQGGRVLDLGTLGGTHSAVVWPGLNDRGTVVGIAETATDDPNGEAWSCSAFFPTATGKTCVGFVWERGRMRPLPTFGGPNGFATQVNNRGQVAGWAENTVEDPTCNAPQRLQFRAAVWDTRRGGMTELPPLAGDPTSAATAINERGTVVGISGLCGDAVGGYSARHAVLWDRGRVEDLGNLGGDSWHTPMDLNERDVVVGFSNPAGSAPGDFNVQAFRWTRRGGIEPLGTLPGDATSQALGVNNRGVVVGLSVGDGGFRAVVWDGDTPVDLNMLVPAEWAGRLLIAGHINDRGQITGTARDPETGGTQAFVATPTRRRR